MRMSKEFEGVGPNLAFEFANGQYWQKIMTIPLLYQADGLVNAHLRNPQNNSQNMVVNASSVAPVTFQFISPQNSFFAITQISLVLVDSGISPLNFGGLAALTNGMSLVITDENDVTKYNLHAGETIKQNYEFYHIAGSRIALSSGQGGDSLIVTWSSDIIGVYPTMRPGWKAKAIIRDNLTGIDKFEATIAGAYLPPDIIFVT